ncbi:MAG: hypothetical protein SXV54_08535 [Chloroflexota bacterium]|nr:hypothetical protein [Chloroflexota bacterium]
MNTEQAGVRGQEQVEGTGEDGKGGRLKGRLKGVRKRKRARRDFECEAVASKMRLVKVEKVEEEGDN